MENNSGQQTEKKTTGDQAGKNLEGLPLETSPYVQYKDLEDYKRKGYGTEGHMEPTPGRGPGGTDAPTPSGGAPPSQPAAGSDSATDVINRQGVP